MKYRVRNYHYIADAVNGDLVYDLERTHVYTVPQSLSSQDLSGYTSNKEAFDWLVSNDILTESSLKSFKDSKGADLPVLTDLSIDMSGACNMGCHYCFEKDINSRLGKISEETAISSVDYFFSQNANAQKVALHFGSGEPLLQFKTLQKIVARAQELCAKSGQHISFELTTNGTLVTEEIAEFFLKNNFNIRVSFDGPPEIHDQYRPMANDQPSYHKVLAGLQILLRYMPERVTVNSVLASGTRLIELWKWAQQLGIRQFHVIKVGTYVEDDFKLREEELGLFEADLWHICNDILSDLQDGKTPANYQPITKIIRRLMLPQPITRFCGVAGTYLGVSSKGKIYPCFRHIGLENYGLGDVWNGADAEKRKSFLEKEAADVDSRPICNQCWARYMCGGGCYADSTVYGPDATLPKIEHCDFWRKEIEVAIKFYRQLIDEDPSFVLSLFGDSVDKFEEAGEINILRKQNCS